jgi:hypothetical protein
VIGGALDVAAGVLDVLTDATKGAAAAAEKSGGQEEEADVAGDCFHVFEGCCVGVFRV